MIKSSREMAIESFYRTVLKRDPDSEGLRMYCDSSMSLESIYKALYTSDEAKSKRKEEARRRRLEHEKVNLPITLAVFAKDAEDSIPLTINSVKSFVNEIVVVDTGSSDNTVGVCEKLGARVYKCGFSDFGSIRTLTGHLAREEWVLGLDADEIMLGGDYHFLKGCVETEGVDIWGLPRKRWLELDMETQLEKDVYPDYQYRLFRNKPTIFYKRRIHEIVDGSEKRKEAKEGPHIHHFQDVFKSGPKLKKRNELYKELQKKDLEEGIEHTESAVQEIDEVE